MSIKDFKCNSCGNEFTLVSILESDVEVKCKICNSNCCEIKERPLSYSVCDLRGGS